MDNKNGSTECCSTADKVIESIEINKLSSTTLSTFIVSGMDCADEVGAIQKQLQHPKVAKINANIMTSQVSVEHAPELERAEIIKLINKVR